MSNFEEQFYLARVAEHCERYEDMIDFLKILKQKEDDLTVDERNLLSVAYKNSISERRTAWRAFCSIAQNKKYEKYSKSIQEYKDKVVEEMQGICDRVVIEIDHFLEKAKDEESKVFFYKMKADYFRYMSEVSTGDKLEQIKASALQIYEQANSAADKLSISHPIRLGLALNYSVFHFEIMEQPKKACELAKAVFDQAINEIDDVDESQYKDSAMILQLLRDNITLWNTQLEEEEENEGQKNDDDVIDI